jgi:predicted small secreted protein
VATADNKADSATLRSLDMRHWHLYLLAVIVGTILALSLPGCNTMKGVGSDIHDSASIVQGWIDQASASNDRMGNEATSTARR